MEWIIGLIIITILIWIPNRLDRKRPRSYESKYDSTDWDQYAAEQQAKKAADDLSVVSTTNYWPRSVMGKEEAYLFYKIENWVDGRGKGERVFAQVPMGTYLKAYSDYAHRLIRHKRPDYLIVNRVGMPVCVIEYQGGGHYQGDALERDQIKRAALENANIPLVEVFEHEKDDLETILLKLNSAVDQDGTHQLVEG